MALIGLTEEGWKNVQGTVTFRTL